MRGALELVHWIAALIVLAEALNKLERTAPLARGLCGRRRLVDGLKAVAWLLLALGAGGELAAPLLDVFGVAANLVGTAAPSLSETAVIAGFAVLIVRTRVKEG